MKINVRQFIDCLPIMGKGFLGIFIILGIIIIATVLLNAITKKGKKNAPVIIACFAALLAVVGAAVLYGFLR